MGLAYPFISHFLGSLQAFSVHSGPMVSPDYLRSSEHMRRYASRSYNILIGFSVDAVVVATEDAHPVSF